MESKGIVGALGFEESSNVSQEWVRNSGRYMIIHNSESESEALRFEIATDSCKFKHFADNVYIWIKGYLCDDLKDTHGSSIMAVYSLYKKYGIRGMLQRIDGSYLIVIADTEKQVAYIAVDRLASQPIFFNVAEGIVQFSSVLSEFRNLDTISRTVNVGAVASMLGSGWLHNDSTYYNEVSFLQSARYISVTSRGYKVVRYWDYSIRKDEESLGINIQEYKKVLKGLLVAAVEKRTRRNVPALLLSGGIDSRLLLGVMRDLGRNVDTYSYTHHDVSGDDCFVAEQSARAAGVKFNKIVISELDPYEGILISAGCWDGMRNWSYEYKPLSCLGAISQQWMSGDESFGWNRGAYINEHDFLAHIGITFISQQKEFRRFMSTDLYEEFVQAEQLTYEALCESVKDYDLLNSADYLYTTERLPRNILPCRHIITQQNCNVINPWLDKDVLEFMSQVPQRYRTNKRLVRELASEMYPDLFGIVGAKFGGASAYVRKKYKDRSYVDFLLERSNNFYNGKIDLAKIKGRLIRNDGLIASNTTKAKYKMLRGLHNRLGWLPKIVEGSNMPINFTNQQLMDRIAVMGIICYERLGLRL